MDRRRVRVSFCLVTAILTLTQLAVTTSAEAAAPVNLHKVSFANRSVPGSTCFSSKPIRLHKGHGHGGQHLVVDLGSTRYGDLTHDGHDEALVNVECSTGGETAASQVKDTWAVFTAHGRSIRPLGVIAPRHQFRHVHNTLLGPPHISRGVATVTEYVYGPADADCCSSLRASTTWVAHKGAMKVTSTSLRGDLLITAQGMAKARLGMTLAQLRVKYPNLDAYGRSGTCSNLASFGRQYDQYADQYLPMFAYFKHGRIVRIDPGSDNAVTSHGIGKYSSPSDVRHAYPGAVSSVRHQGYSFLHARLRHSSLSMLIEKESYGTFVQFAPIVYAGHARVSPGC